MSHRPKFNLNSFVLAIVCALFSGSAVFAWQRTLVEEVRRIQVVEKKAKDARISDLESQIVELQDTNATSSLQETDGDTSHGNQIGTLNNASNIDQKSEINDPCTYDATSLTKFRKAVTSDFFGTEVFDTVVCGYLTSADQVVFAQQKTIAYFHIVEAASGFSGAISTAISQHNAINRQGGQTFEFRLGCVDKQAKTGLALAFDQGIIKKDKLDAITEASIIASTSEHPINIMFSFELGEQTQPVVCNSLATHMQVVK